MSGKEDRKSHTDDFKQQICNLIKSGKPRKEICEEYGISKSLLSIWYKQFATTGSFAAKDNRTPEENRILELEKENKQLRMEVDILKHAALILGKNRTTESKKKSRSSTRIKGSIRYQCQLQGFGNK